MTIKGKYVVVLVTAPNVKTGRALARAALTARLVACANLIPSIESHYWWQGKIDRCPEVLLLMKTTAAHLSVLEQLIRARHPYDTPEFVVLPICRGSKRYLAWVRASVGGSVR